MHARGIYLLKICLRNGISITNESTCALSHAGKVLAIVETVREEENWFYSQVWRLLKDLCQIKDLAVQRL